MMPWNKEFQVPLGLFGLIVVQFFCAVFLSAMSSLITALWAGLLVGFTSGLRCWLR